MMSADDKPEEHQPEPSGKATKRFSGLMDRLTQVPHESKEQTDRRGGAEDEDAETKKNRARVKAARAAVLAKVEALNKKHFVINNIGGKCLIGEFIPSSIDPGCSILSYQASHAFTLRYKNQKVGEIDEEDFSLKKRELGSYWLGHAKRRGYEGTDLVAGGPETLPGNRLNLWRGFGVEAKAGKYPRTRAHMRDILANGDPLADQYIWNWNAWLMQHPDKQAEVALVLQGLKGAGKGVIGQSVRQILGPHGMHISSPNHLVGNFNGHLESCVFLFADEAFAVEDKKSESILKALITEPVMTVEPKHINAYQVRNRLHVWLAANHEWVVPATGDERRFAVFYVSDARRGDAAYFKTLYDELDNGGREALLYDLLNTNLGGWHPRQVYETEALRQQKALSLSGEEEWLEGILQEGIIPHRLKSQRDSAIVKQLIEDARDRVPKLKYMGDHRFGSFLRKTGCVAWRSAQMRGWKFPPLADMRAAWENKFGGWRWREPDLEKWE